MKKLLFLTFGLLFQMQLSAQEICNNGIDDDGDGLIDCVDDECACDYCSENQANIWYFGGNAGLSFNSGSPVSISGGQVNTGEGCATLSDPNGNLLFYTDGRTVWDRNHAIMPNGTGLFGNASSTQSGVIVPHPGDPTLFYVFTVDFTSGSNGMRYSIVDLSLNSGFGQVTTKNILLLASTTEKIGVVKHCNNRDYWIMGHEYNTNRFFVYELNTTGLNATPNIQAIGTVHDGGIANKLGYLKPSADGKKLACAIFRKSTIDLFDFDNSTGIISNHQALVSASLADAYGIEFSLTGRFLYATALANPCKLVQLDLSLATTPAILASMTVLAQKNDRYEYGALQMGPDGRIYVARRNVTNPPLRTFISSINNPEVAGVGATFQDTAVVVTPGGSNLSLPTFVQSYLLPVSTVIISRGITPGDTLCTTTGENTYQVTGTFDGCGLDTVLWQHYGDNNVTEITDTTLTLNANMFGVDTIIAEVRTFCASSFDTLIVSTVVCPEVCDNGIDDDGDGLIDCYDSDCCGHTNCENHFYQNCAVTCQESPNCLNFSLTNIWTSQANVGNYPCLVAGDIDNDSIPEIITYRINGNQLFVIDGSTGNTEVTITTAAVFDGGTAPAIADIDGDGFGEIMIIDRDRRICCYEHDGTLKYRTATAVGHGTGYSWGIVNLADIDENGTVEIVIGNQIYDALTGNLLITGLSTGGQGAHPGRNMWRFGAFAAPVVVDALPDTFCTNCAGLEIVAGNQVYSVDIASGTIQVEVQAAGGLLDGYTSIADFDGDGDLDAMVQTVNTALTQKLLYCWDIQTSTIMRQFPIPGGSVLGGAPRVNIADLDGDGELEVSFCGYPLFYALDNDFSVLWQRPNTDGSQVTTSTVFDFCGDGSYEVVYRDMTHLTIFDGTTGNILIQNACPSSTHIESPIILDINGDGLTEIVTTCGASAASGTVNAYASNSFPWVNSRTVWNQHAYFNTNINEDLTIPRVMQDHHLVGDSLVLNNFMNQYFDPQFPVADATVQIISDDRVLPDSVEVMVEICNIGDRVLSSATPISFYNDDPTSIASASLIAPVYTIGRNIEPSICDTFIFRVLGIATADIYAVVNCDNSVPLVFDFNTDFPMTTIGECDYTNNMDNEIILLTTDWEYYEVKKYQETKAQIRWKLQNVSNYQTIEVERSGNAQFFETIATQISPSQNQYIDIVPLGGDNYYRLKLIAQDGSYTYTAIKHLYFPISGVDLVAVPNPFSGNLTIELKGEAERGIQQIQIINVLGQTIHNQKIKAATKHQINLNHLVAGAYWLKVQVGETWMQRKIIKQ